MKIGPVGAEFYHEDWQMDERTDMSQQTVAFRNFTNAPKTRNINPILKRNAPIV